MTKEFLRWQAQWRWKYRQQFLAFSSDDRLYCEIRAALIEWDKFWPTIRAKRYQRAKGIIRRVTKGRRQSITIDL